MKQVVQTQRDGHLRLAEVPAPALQPGGVLVRTAYSLISAGTERAKVEVAKKSLLGKALARPDQVRQVIETARQAGWTATYHKVTNRLEALSSLGYSSAGVVVAVGDQVHDLAAGDRVACAGGGYANHAEIVYIPRNLCAQVPDGVGLDEAAYATVGAIALQGVRQAAPTLGETVGVIGLGLVGQLTAQLLHAAGCRVVGIETSPWRRELAEKLGVEAVAAPQDPALANVVRRLSPAGLDAVILTAATASSEPIRLAGELARDRARIVVVGAVGLDIPRSPFYEKELEVRLSRSYGPGRYDSQYEEAGIDYPIGYVRWTEGRNLAAFLDQIRACKLDVKTLTTHAFKLDDAQQAYALIESQATQPYLGVLLDYGLPTTGPVSMPSAAPIRLKPNAPVDGQIGLALVGAGNFAQSMLLPTLKGHRDVRLRIVVTATGLTARSVAERNGFETCAADVETALADPQVGLVLIATRHDSHADLAARALRAGKAVFVEKPLALTPEQLAEVVEAFQGSSFLMVGFNRRFAPLAVRLRDFVRSAHEPLLLHYRVNAGYIPREHWTQDATIGGGRILGEICHFVDFLMYLVAQPVSEVSAAALPDSGRYSRDNLTVNLRFSDGSVGTITYAANGDRGLDKERVEVFGGGRAAVLNDFRELILSAGGRRINKKASPDKGHRAEMLALVAAMREGQPAPIPFAQLVETTRVTFGILESLASGAPVKLPV